MKRRNFLKIFPPLSIAPFTVNGFNVRPFANRKMAQILNSCDGVNERILVLVQLKGGNDGVNTVIPMNQYDRYAQLRPTIRLEQNALLNLDGTLPLADQVGLNPALTGFKDLYDRGYAALVQGVGYQSMNQSHFKGTDIWLTGGGGSYALNNLSSGWMGRALQAFSPDVEGYPTPEMPDPLGIQVGDPNTSLGFHTETEHQNSINLSGQDPAGFYSLIQTIGGAPVANVPDSDHGDELAFIMGVQDSIGQYSQRISSVFNAGSNALTYPNTSLANQLKTVARLISGGSRTKIFLCQIGGFDTHSAQVDQAATANGTHANLLKTIGDAMKTFFDDLDAQGLSEMVMACTFSEFGRCAAENGSVGTDHGTLAPIMVFGKSVYPGVYGTNVNLSDLTNDNQLKNMQYDYRQVFGTLLQDWLGANSYVMEQAMFDGYQKMPLLDKADVVRPECYIGGSYIATDLDFQRLRPLTIAPNPASVACEVTYESDRDFNARLTLHSIGGQLVFASVYALYSGTNVHFIDVSNMPSGMYVMRVEDLSTGKAELAKLNISR